jgi:hypothetical protein
VAASTKQERTDIHTRFNVFPPGHTRYAACRTLAQRVAAAQRAAALNGRGWPRCVRDYRLSLFIQLPHEGQPSRSAHAARALEGRDGAVKAGAAAVDHERQRRDDADLGQHQWGRAGGAAGGKAEEAEAPKETKSFGLSGLLAAETRMFQVV